VCYKHAIKKYGEWEAVGVAKPLEREWATNVGDWQISESMADVNNQLILSSKSLTELALESGKCKGETVRHHIKKLDINISSLD